MHEHPQHHVPTVAHKSAEETHAHVAATCRIHHTHTRTDTHTDTHRHTHRHAQTHTHAHTRIHTRTSIKQQQCVAVTTQANESAHTTFVSLLFSDWQHSVSKTHRHKRTRNGNLVHIIEYIPCICLYSLYLHLYVYQSNSPSIYQYI